MKTVHFIIPLSGRYETLKRFLANFEKVCLAPGDNVKLAVVLFKGPESDKHSDDDIAQLVDDLRIKYPTHDLRVIRADGPFNRGLYACLNDFLLRYAFRVIYILPLER